MAEANSLEQVPVTHTASDSKSLNLNLEVTVSIRIPKESFETTLQATQTLLQEAVEKSFEREKTSFEQLGVRVENVSSHVSAQAFLSDALFERGFFQCAGALTPLIDVSFEEGTLKFLGSHYDVVPFKDPSVVRAVEQIFGGQIAVEVDSIQATEVEPPLIQMASAIVRS